MKKTLLFILFITALPVVASAESLHLLFPVATSASINDISDTSYTNGHSIHYVGSSGFGIGLTELNWKGATDNDTTTTSKPAKKINFTALEISYTLGYITFGLGNPVNGLMQKTDGNSIYTYSIYSYSGNTAFATLALNIFEKGSLLIGYHMSSLTFKSFSYSESGTLNNVMLGFRIPV